MKYLIFIILLPINLFFLLLIKILKKFLNIKFYKIRTERIGHLFFNTLLFIERKKKKIYHQNKKINFLIPYIDHQSIISNKYLLRFWKKFLYFHKSRLIKYLLLTDEKIFKNNDLKLNVVTYDYNGTLDNLSTKVFFSKNELEKGYSFLKNFGLNKDDKFVCLLVRDNNYLKKKFPNKDFSYHDHRNSNIFNYEKACKYLISKGIFIFKMGLFSDKKLKLNKKYYFDYANSNARSDFFDIFLSAYCYFWISTGTGLDASNYVFNKPILYTNRSPIGYLMAKNNSLSLIKHHYDTKLMRNLTLREINNNVLINAATSSDFLEKGINLVENSEEEIFLSTQELYESLTGNFRFIKEREELNLKARKLIKYDSKFFLDINFNNIENFKNHPFFSYNFLIKNQNLLN